MKTIFISIAAQDDEETKNTIRHAFENAEHPERVFVGVGLTCMKSKYKKELDKISKFNPNVKINYVKQKKNNIDTLGIGQGRYRAASLYENQDYMLQIDCHTYLDKFWDTKMISMFQSATEEIGDDKFVISCIPLVYSYDENDNVQKHEEPHSRYATYVTDQFFVSVVPMWKEVDILNEYPEQFIPAHKFNPACTFGNYHFATNPGIYYDAIFYDEDWTQQLNLFERGFAFVFPSFKDFPVRHLDGNYISKGHERYFFTEYLSQKENEKIHQKLKSGYLDFVTDKQNQKAIEKYYKYSKAHAKRGYVSVSNKPFPKRYRVEE